jgi:hypothetical protein
MSILDDFKSIEERHKTDIEKCERTLQLAREAIMEYDSIMEQEQK